MPLTALRATSTAQNGVGAFILQCKRLDFHYCDHGASSKGMREYLRSPLLASLATAYPQITLHVSPRPNAHPIVRASYVNGREKVVCVRRMDKGQIGRKAALLRDASGEAARRVRGGRVVGSVNEGVRGVWDPFHGGNREIRGDRVVAG